MEVCGFMSLDIDLKDKLKEFLDCQAELRDISEVGRAGLRDFLNFGYMQYDNFTA